MSLRILLHLREKQSVPEESGDCENYMEANTDAQREQQYRLHGKEFRFGFTLDHSAKIRNPKFLSQQK